MSELRKKEPAIIPEPNELNPEELKASAEKTAKKVIGKILTYVPAVIIFGLIALYYIQLSHMA